MVELKGSLVGLENHALAKILPSPIRELDAEFSKMPDLIKLTLGEPDFNAPDIVKAAAKRAIDENDSHYALAVGHLSLREAISGYLHERFALPRYDAETEVVVTVGASEALFSLLNGVFSRGDQIIIPTPTFPMYEALAIAAGLEIIPFNTAPDFKLDPARLAQVIAAHPDAKGILFNYPSNPTGVSYTPAEVEALADMLGQSELLVMSDEIYAELVYDTPHRSIAALLPEQSVVISGVSKAHAMTGYRIGYIAGPAKLMQRIKKMHQFTVAAAPGPMMAAAEAAIRHGAADTEAMRQTYETRRDLVVAGLTAAGFEVATPNGAFYIFAKLPANLDMDDVTFVKVLAREGGVGLAPGSMFGSGGEGYVRLSYAASTEVLTEAVQRIQKFMTK